MIKIGSRYPRKLYHGDRRVNVLSRGSRIVYVSPELTQQMLKEWLFINAKTLPVMVSDAEAKWLELEITLPATWTGNAVDGYTGPMDASGTVATLGLTYSTDLQTWSTGGWIEAPGKSTINVGDGTKKFFVRYAETPSVYYEVQVDLRATSNRYGKSITAIDVLGVSVALPNFPYAMPADAATLQADLRDEGFTGALVTSTSHALSVGIKNHTDDGPAKKLTPVLSGSNVTNVTFQGSSITLPAYPYSLPADAADLQADLRTAGYSGAVVKLFDDEWSVFLPNLLAGDSRPYDITFSPGDPFPFWNMFKIYQGLNPDDDFKGSHENLRTPGGAPLTEHAKAFARLGFIFP
jgi:hypothetical protein